MKSLLLGAFALTICGMSASAATVVASEILNPSRYERFQSLKPIPSRDLGKEGAPIRGFAERQDITLTSDLRVDGRTLPAGTTLSSYLLLRDPKAADVIRGTLTFDSTILGVIAKSGRLDRTDALFARDSLDLPDIGLKFRGIERVVRFPHRRDRVRIDGNELHFRLFNDRPGDTIRVLTASTRDLFNPGGGDAPPPGDGMDTSTPGEGGSGETPGGVNPGGDMPDVPAVPVPAGLPLLLTGLGAFAALRRWKRAA